MDSLTADKFWTSFLQSLPEEHRRKKRYYETFCFGNNERLANLLADLVMKGIKSATSSLLWENEATKKPLQRVGDLSIVTRWDKEPVCIIETLEVRIMPFNEVDPEFIYDEGEGDRSLEWWNNNMWEYFSEECRTLGRAPAPAMPVVCERFRVVFPKRT